MASCTVSVGHTGSAKLPSKQSRRVLHRPVSPYERENSPVLQACTMDGSQLQCDNSEIKSLLISIQELAQKKHILNPVYLLYSDACRIYSAVVEGCNPPRGICDSKDGEAKLQIYSLVFETVQCIPAIHHWLEESGIFEKYYELHNYERMVELMAYDLQRQQFNLPPPHPSNDNVPPPVRAVASILWAHRTKLSASLARIRIEQNAPTLHHLVPDGGKAKLDAWKDNPCYGRITRPDRRDEIILSLTKCDLTHVQELSGKELQSFYLFGTDKNVIAFSPDCREILYRNSYMITSGQLIVQDYDSCWFAECVGKMAATNSGDIIITNLWSGVTILHIASLTTHNIIVYGVTPLQSTQLQDKIKLLNLHNILLIDEPFIEASPHDTLLENVSIILCCPVSTLSAVSNPVDYLLQEGGDDNIAFLLAPADSRKICHKTLHTEQTTTLLHALKFSQAEQIVYSTESSLEEENEAIVRQAVATHNKCLQSSGDEELRKFRSMPHIMRLFFQSGSGSSHCNNSGSHDDSDANVSVSCRYHITVLEKEPLPPATPPKDVIARAVANGLLSGVDLGENGKGTEKVKKKKKKVPGFARPTAASDAKARSKSHVHHKKKTKKRKPTC